MKKELIFNFPFSLFKRKLLMLISLLFVLIFFNEVNAQTHGERIQFYNDYNEAVTNKTRIIKSDSNLFREALNNGWFDQVALSLKNAADFKNGNNVGSLANLTVSNSSCETKEPFCTGAGYTYPAATNMTFPQVGPDYGCLVIAPNPTWFYMKIETAGAISFTIKNSNNNDQDFILWGPFSNIDVCDSLTADKIIDCSWIATTAEQMYLPTSQVGEYYVLLITNFLPFTATDISIVKTSGTGETDCNIIPGYCVNPTSAGTIGNAQQGCPEFNPYIISSLTLASGNSGTLEYKWQLSTTSSDTGFSDILNSNSTTYDPPTISTSTWYKRLARVDCKNDWMGAIESNVIKMTADDITAPSITSTHNDTIVLADEDCHAILPNYMNSVIATDNCDSNLIFTQFPSAGTTISGAENTITLTVTDHSDNSTEVSYNISVVENIDPIITSIHNDQAIEANENCQAILPNYKDDVIATDNCDSNLTITQTPFAGTIITSGKNKVTLTVTDDYGNTAKASFNVTVDIVPPIITSTHIDQFVNADSNCQAILPDYTGDIIATDNCDSDLTVFQTHSPGKTIWGATNSITLSVFDDSGNSTHKRFNVAVVDNTSPTITCVGDQTVDPDKIDSYTISGEMFDPVSTNDNCAIASVENSFNNSSTLNGAILPLGLTTITWTVTDNNGNTDRCSFNVTVNGTLSIETLEKNGISIYPNPTKEKIILEFSISRTREITILDLMGNTVFMKTIEDKIETIDLSKIVSGIYIICIKDDEKAINARIIKQ